MPRKPRITRDMVIEAAFEVAREEGYESINARRVAGRLGCSTQPVMYHFSTMESLKREAYDKADAMHIEYLLNVPGDTDPMLAIGLNYIRFAVQEKNLFRFLFQSGRGEGKDILSMIDSEDVYPVLMAIREGLGTDINSARDAFLMLALFVHGYACLIAFNDLAYDENTVAGHLEKAWEGAAAAAVKEEE